MQRIKNLQNYQSKKTNSSSIQRDVSKSKSKGKKGMTCTLYQKSI